MKKFLPILDWLPKYTTQHLKGDLPAGLTVGIMLIPQGMAYALIAGLPAVYGLYAALMPQVVYAVFGTSRQLAVGPVAMDSLLVASGLTVIASAGSEHYITMAILLAFLMGAMQFLMGIFRMGFIVNFLSRPVISGFTSAAALIIGLNQLKYLLGVDIERSNRIHEIMVDAGEKIGGTSMLALGIGLGGIALIVILRKISKRIPAALVVVVAGILVVYGLSLDQADVNVVGEIPAGFPTFTVPELTVDNFKQLWPIAITLALIAFMEAISQGKAIEEKHNDYEIDPNQELRALGLANIVGSFFQAYPTTGGFSRTAVNHQSGARTGLAALISAAVVALVLLFLTPLFYFLPKAVLASIIMVAVFGLINVRYPIELWRTQKAELGVLLITFGITAFVGITEGILSGVMLSLLLMVFRTTKPHIAVLGEIAGVYKNVDRFDEAKTRPDVLAFRFDGQLYYANKDYFKQQVERMIADKGEALALVVLNAEAINYIDASAAATLEKMVCDLKAKGIQFRVAGAIGPVRDTLLKMKLRDLIGPENFYIRTAQAIASIDQPDTRSPIKRHIATQSQFENGEE